MKNNIIIFILIFCINHSFADDPANILFVGNSFTYYNDMPDMIQALAVANDKVINIEAATKGGYSIAQHAKDPKTLNALASKKWDIIVFQGHSLEPLTDKANMIKSGKELAGKCKEAKLMLYLTWAYQTKKRFLEKVKKTNIGKLKREEQMNMFSNMQKLLTEGYNALAEEIHAEVVPVGLAWQASRKQHPDLNLFNKKDQFHPSKQGSYLSAIVFYKAIFGETPEKAALNSSNQADHNKMKAIVDGLK